MRFYNRELLTNLFIILLGMVLAILPIVIVQDVTLPISVISISIGCSLIATGISVLLSFIYRERNTKFYEYLSKIGLSDILIDIDMYEYSVKAIMKADRNIYYAQIGAPLIILQNPKLFDRLVKSGVSIKILVNPEQFGKEKNFPTFTDHDRLALQECYKLSMSIGVEIRETDYPLTRTLIVDDEVILINKRVSNRPMISVVYHKNKTEAAFYKYQFDLFQDIWNTAKAIDTKI